MDGILDFQKLSEIVGGSITQLHSNHEISDIITDSRKVHTIGLHSVFFAINGIHHDGHLFLEDLYNKNLRNIVVEKEIDWHQFPEANILVVENSIQALQKLATFHRSEFQIPVVGITGSNAKTIVKEWLFQLLSGSYEVLQSPRSYNSQLGVSLSVWQLNSGHEQAIFEAGISTVNEMRHLETIIKPTVGIFTNIGSAHEQGFSSVEEKVKEKLQLFKTSELIIYCQDHKLIHDMINESSLINCQLLSWSFNADSPIKIKTINARHFEIKFNQKVLRLKLPFADRASHENLFHCISYLLHLGFEEPRIQVALNRLEPIKMRLALKQGINGCSIVDDTYNNDLVGLEFALQFLHSQHQRSSKTVILSDIPQSSLSQDLLYQKVGQLLKSQGVKRFIGIGPELYAQKEKIDIPGEYFNSTDSFLKDFKTLVFENEMVLVKGARVFEFEKIVSQLVEKLHETVLEIDLDALTHNLNFYRNKLRASTKLMVMVKALAYGSGSAEISNLLQFHKVDYLAVAYTDEGVELRKNGVQLPVMVMNPKNDLVRLLENDLEPEVFGLSQLQRYVEELKLINQELGVHLNINTGMNRLGVDAEEIDQLIEALKVSPQIKVKSIFTHLAGADSTEHRDFSLQQLHDFEPIAQQLEKALGYSTIKHALNSAGILSFPEYQMDMVRLGIGLHGFDPSGHANELFSVSTLKTIISQIRKIEEGETIGYGRKGTATKDCVIATIALGYADGFSRAFSDGIGQVMINGNLANVIGNVCMDMTMIDITGIDAKEGDEVIIFGKELPIQQVASSIDTIPYEILTSVSSRVKRIYFSH